MSIPQEDTLSQVMTAIYSVELGFTVYSVEFGKQILAWCGKLSKLIASRDLPEYLKYYVDDLQRSVTVYEIGLSAAYMWNYDLTDAQRTAKISDISSDLRLVVALVACESLIDNSLKRYSVSQLTERRAEILDTLRDNNVTREDLIDTIAHFEKYDVKHLQQGEKLLNTLTLRVERYLQLLETLPFSSD